MNLSRPRRTILRLTLYGLFISLLVGPLHAAEPFSPARVAVYFSPKGWATDAVLRELNTAQTQVLMQAYSFTSAPIAKALVEAHKRGVKVLAILDKSNETDKFSGPRFSITPASSRSSTTNMSRSI
jgi:phosphatidylserine/phosphatidylglycerophosphate/cardiolipin synthase-like enzyme